MSSAAASADRLSIVEEVIRQASAPLAVAAIAKALKSAIRISRPDLLSSLEELARASRIHAWGSGKYWTKSPDTHLQEQIENAARTLARKQTDLASAVRKVSFGLPADRVKKAIQRLQSEGILKQYPAIEGGRTLVLAHRDAPGAYLATINAPFRSMLSRLESAGHSPEEVIRHLESMFAKQAAETGTLLQALQAMASHRGAPVSAQRLRANPLLKSWSKQQFDAAALELFAARKVILSRHDDALGLPEIERSGLITDGKEMFYVGIAER